LNVVKRSFFLLKVAHCRNVTVGTDKRSFCNSRVNFDMNTKCMFFPFLLQQNNYRILILRHFYKPYTYGALHGNKHSKTKFQKSRIRNFLSRFLPFLYLNIHEIEPCEIRNKTVYVLKDTLFCCFFGAWLQIISSFVSFIVLKIESPLK